MLIIWNLALWYGDSLVYCLECSTPGSTANIDLSLHISPAAISHKMRSVLSLFCYLVQFSVMSCISRKIIVSHVFPFACPMVNFCHHQIIHKSCFGFVL
ncbi:unnamed protein product, partial [Vitis vinifera]|uniref:Uncharacterized protein n=1 Tax=Vitis vinifera TaxID=29760 RepID=D7U7Z3_VITVI